jgi:drug/metabolite transporter (DMT)-like permease
MVGFLAALGCSLGLGLAVAVARFAFEGGTNGATVALLRAWLLVGLTGIFCLASGRHLALPWPQWRHCLWLGLLMANMFYANIAAVQFIPIGLAALLFFTYPPMVAVGNALLVRRWPGSGRMLAVAVAFAGLALMLGASIDHVHPVGIALSLSAALATAANVLGSARVLSRGDRWVMFWHMALIAALCITVLALAGGALVQPVTAGGWGGMIGVAVLQASSIPLFYVALAQIGPERSAMFNNLQPVISILAAYLLFGELLTPAQFAGAALVLGGIALMQWLNLRNG